MSARYTAGVACKLYRIPIWGCVAGVLAAMLALSATGCGNVASGAAPAGSVIVVAVDRSVVGSGARDTQILQLDSLTKSASEARYLLDLWTYDQGGAVHIWGPDLLPDADDLDEIQSKNLPQIKTGERLPGRADQLIDSIMAEHALTSVAYGRVLLLTDGDLSGTDGSRLLSSAAKLIAARPGWRLEILGISTHNRPIWQTALGPVLGDRFELVDEHDATAILKQNHDE